MMAEADGAAAVVQRCGGDEIVDGDGLAAAGFAAKR